MENKKKNSYRTFIFYIVFPLLVTLITYSFISDSFKFFNILSYILTSLKDLIFPAFVAILASYGSYLATYNSNKKSLSQEKQLHKFYFVDKLLTQINKFVVITEILREDNTTLKYFSFTNIYLAREIADKLKEYESEVYILTNLELRGKIIDSVESVKKLVEEMNFLEKIVIDDRSKFEQQIKDTTEEINKLDLKNLELDILLQSSTKNKNGILENKKKITDNIKTTFINGLNEKNKKLDQTVKDIERRRMIITTQLIDVKRELKDLAKILDKTKIELSSIIPSEVL